MSILDRILLFNIKLKIKVFIFSIGFMAVMAGWCLIHFDDNYHPIQLFKPKMYVRVAELDWDKLDVNVYKGNCTKVTTDEDGEYVFTFENGKKVHADKNYIYEPSIDKVNEFEKKCEEYYKK